MRILKAIVIFIAAAACLVGFAICAFPVIQRIVVDRQMQNEAAIFFEKVETTPSQSSPVIPALPSDTRPAELPTPYPELLTAMQQYNEQIWEEKQAGLCDPWSYTQPSFTLGDFGIEGEVFGVISIPELDLNMPLYLGATNRHLADGAAQLSQTSIPIGGENTNAVIAGHRGWQGASYFRYITQLQPGDQVILTNLWGELEYEVTETKIIAPNEVNQILIQKGRDMITLLTCHPYASGGEQRYLVFCDRVTEEGGSYVSGR